MILLGHFDEPGEEKSSFLPYVNLANLTHIFKEYMNE